MTTKILGLDSIEVILSLISWGLICAYYLFQFYRRFHYHKDIEVLSDDKNDFKFYPSYFYQMRGGWVRRNFLTGQAAANSTRDYLRVLIFFCGNSGVLGLFFCGYTISAYDPDGDANNHFVTFKLAACSFMFLVIFFLFIYSTRYATQFQ